MPRSTFNVCLDPTRKTVLFKVETKRTLLDRGDVPEGGFIAPFSPEEARIIGHRMLVHADEAENNRRGGGS